MTRSREKRTADPGTREVVQENDAKRMIIFHYYNLMCDSIIGRRQAPEAKCRENVVTIILFAYSFSIPFARESANGLFFPFLCTVNSAHTIRYT